jgi:hypothetical protein
MGATRAAQLRLELEAPGRDNSWCNGHNGLLLDINYLRDNIVGILRLQVVQCTNLKTVIWPCRNLRDNNVMNKLVCNAEYHINTGEREWQGAK